MIIADTSHPDDRAALEQWRRREAVQFAATFDDVITAACAGEARIAVSDADRLLPGAAGQFGRTYSRALQRIPVILRTSLEPRALEEILVLAELGDPTLPLHVSYRPFDPLDGCLARNEFERPRSATMPILCATCRLLPKGDPQRTFVAVCVMAERLVSLTEVAAARGPSEDTIERHLAACGFREFREFRALCVVAHALVRYQRHGQSVTRCAEALGMDLKGFSQYVTDWFDESFTGLARGGGYDAVIDRIVARLADVQRSRRT